jgi:hypothetical protein
VHLALKPSPSAFALTRLVHLHCLVVPCYAFSYFLPIPPPVSCWLPFSRQAAALTGPFGEAKKGSHQTPRRATVRPYFLRKYGRKCGLLFWLGRSVWLAAGSWCVWCGAGWWVVVVRCWLVCVVRCWLVGRGGAVRLIASVCGACCAVLCWDAGLHCLWAGLPGSCSDTPLSSPPSLSGWLRLLLRPPSSLP